MGVKDQVVDRIENMFGKMNTPQKMEYAKALSCFSSDILGEAMDIVLKTRRYNSHPMPGVINSECENIEMARIKPIETHRTDYDIARSFFEGKKSFLAKHEAFDQIDGGHTIARDELKLMIDARAWIAAQVICQCKGVGYDNDRAFGTSTWKGDFDIELIRRRAKQMNSLDIFVPSKAVDYFNNLPNPANGMPTAEQLSKLPAYLSAKYHAK